MERKSIRSNYILAVIITVITALMIVLTSAAKIAIEDQVSTLEVLVYMNVVTTVFFLLYIGVRKTPIHIEGKRLVLLRASMGFVGVYLFFFAYEVGLSLSAGIVIGQLTPIFSVVGMILIMREKISGFQKWMIPVTLFVAFLGVIVIADPTTQALAMSIVPVLVGVAAGVISGFTMVVIRKLMLRNKPEVVGLFNSLFVVLVGMLILVLTGQFRVLSLQSYALLIVVGIFNTFAVFGMALAAVFASPTKTAPYAYFMVLFAPIVQWILFGELISLNIILGGFLIVGINFVNFYSNLKHKKLEEEETNAKTST